MQGFFGKKKVWVFLYLDSHQELVEEGLVLVYSWRNRLCAWKYPVDQASYCAGSPLPSSKAGKLGKRK